MSWQNFFRFSVAREIKGKSVPFYECIGDVPQTFAMQDLVMGRFHQWNLEESEKKRLTLGMRKVLLCHEYFLSSEFNGLVNALAEKIGREKDTELTFSTQGGGIYLFIGLLQYHHLWRHKKITCVTSELPLPVLPYVRGTGMQFIFHPEKESYLADFPSLWKESELLKLFEIKSKKSKVA